MTLIRRQLAATRRQMQHHADRLESLSPLAVLRRGYSVTRTADGYVVREAEKLERGDTLITNVEHATIYSRVERVEAESWAAPLVRTDSPGEKL
jgi:exodeoxyribonuclease VII large subunit